MKPVASRRRGFTLAEVLITIAILAVLAAVLLPILTGQLRKGDISRVSSDLTSVRTGMEAFLADLRRVPGDVEDLVSQPLATASDTDASGDLYPPGLLNRWGGPYIDKEQNASSQIASGFGGLIENSFTSGTFNNTSWAVIQISGLTTAEFEDIDLTLDEAVNSSTGRFRYNASSTALYFAVPLN